LNDSSLNYDEPVAYDPSRYGVTKLAEQERSVFHQATLVGFLPINDFKQRFSFRRDTCFPNPDCNYSFYKFYIL
jgi:hypothetical protein